MNPHDFDWFSVVTFAPPAVQEQVDEIRRLAQLPPRPMIPAHVTLRGTFEKPTDLDLVAAAVRACASAHAPSVVSANRLHVWRHDDRSTVVLLAEVPPEVEALHWDLIAALKWLCVPAAPYRDEESAPYHPHLTLVQTILRANEAAALATIERFSPGYAFTAAEATLMGRRGGTRWERLASFPIGRPSQ